MSRKVKNNRKIKLLLFLVISLFITFFSCVNVKAYYRKNVNKNVSFTTKEYTDLTSSLNKTIYASGNNSTTVELTINNPNNYGVSYTLSFSNTNCTYLIDGASLTTYTVNGSGSKTHVINITGATGDSITVSIKSTRPYSATITKVVNFDASNPVPTIGGGTSAKQTSQTFNLSCTDNIGVVGYYFGTTEPSSSTTFTAVTSTTSWTGTGSANSAATYWLGCKDAVGNIGKTSVVVRSINVSNMLLNINGTEANYNTSHYTRSNNPTYYVKNGTSFSAANMCSSPTGGNSLKGYNEAAPSTTTATIKSTDLVVDGNKTISCWYNRLTYTVTVSKPTNGSIKAETVTQTGNSVTASSSAQTLTVRYGDTVKGTATANTGWHFNGWSGGYLTANTTNPSTGGTITGNKTITGAFTGNTYTLTYSNATATGATVPSATSCTVTSGSSCNVTLANSGYSYSGWTFNGWGTANNSTSGDAGGTSVALTGNVTRYATWKKNAITYTLTYSNATATGATVPSATSCTIAAVYNGATQGTSCNVTPASSGYSYSGWTFNGWGTANNSTSGDAGGTSLTLIGNATRYATWKQTVTRTASYNANGGTGTTNSTSCTFTAYNGNTSGNCNVTLASNGFTKSGYYFSKWAIDSASGTQSNAGASVSIGSNKTFYAIWTSYTLTLRYNVNGGTIETGTGSERWRASSSLVQRSTNSGSSWTTITAVLNATTTDYDLWNVSTYGATKTGYTIVGDSAYNTKADGTGVNINQQNTSSNTTNAVTIARINGGALTSNKTIDMYIKWVETTATLTYNANGCGTAPSNVTMKYTAATSAASSMTMASGWTLTGWNTNSAGTGTSYAAGAQVKAANVVPSAITLYAQCRKSTTRTASYNGNGGTGTTNSTTCTAYAYNGSSTYGSCNVTLASNGYSKTGYNFSKWAIDSASGTQYSAGGSVSISANKTFYAVWNEKTATLTYAANGCGTAPSNVTMKYTTATNAASSMTMASGWELTGWNTASGGNGTAYAKGAQVKAANVVPSAITLYAQCRKGTTRTLTYNGNENTGGSTAASTCTAYAYNGSSSYGGCSVALAANGFTRTGHTFTKWAADSSAGIQYNVGEAIPLNSNRTFYAKWSANSYTLTLAGANPIATSFDGQTVTLAGNTAVPVSASSTLNLATGTSYTVSFDYVTSGVNNQFDVDFYPPDALPQTNPTATTTAHHRDWVTSSTNSGMTSCTLRFFDDFQESNEQDITITNIMLSQNTVTTKTYGSTYGTLPTPTRSGYTFKGWFTAEEGGSQVSSSTQITGNTTWYARWEKNAPAIKWRWRATCSCHASSTQSKYVYSGYNFNTSDEAYFNCNNAGAGLSACRTWCSGIGGTGASVSQCLGMSNAG